MSEIKKLVEGIEKERKKRLLEFEYNPRSVEVRESSIKLRLVEAKLEGVNEGIEAIKKDIEDLKIKYKGQMAVKPAFNKLIKIINGVIEKIKLYEQEGI